MTVLRPALMLVVFMLMLELTGVVWVLAAALILLLQAHALGDVIDRDR